MLFFFFFNDTATTEIYTLSLHDALPILDGLGVPVGLLVLGEQLVLDGAGADVPGRLRVVHERRVAAPAVRVAVLVALLAPQQARSEEHTSELQSRQYLVCRLLLEKKKNK